MRAMLRLKWSASPVRIAVAVMLGVAATALSTWLPLFMVERGNGAQVRTIHRGVHGWRAGPRGSTRWTMCSAKGRPQRQRKVNRGPEKPQSRGRVLDRVA
jgi:hypothetical protein